MIGESGKQFPKAARMMSDRDRQQSPKSAFRSRNSVDEIYFAAKTSRVGVTNS